MKHSMLLLRGLNSAAINRVDATTARVDCSPVRKRFLLAVLWAGRFGRLQRARDTRERLIADKKEAGGMRIASDIRGGAGEGQAPAGCLRRSGGRAEAWMIQGFCA